LGAGTIKTEIYRRAGGKHGPKRSTTRECEKTITPATGETRLLVGAKWRSGRMSKKKESSGRPSKKGFHPIKTEHGTVGDGPGP